MCEPTIRREGASWIAAYMAVMCEVQLRHLVLVDAAGLKPRQGEIFDIPVSGNDAHGLVEAKLSGPILLTGGGFGLEASLISIVIGTAAGLAIVWLAVRRGKLMQPLWGRRPA